MTCFWPIICLAWVLNISVSGLLVDRKFCDIFIAVSFKKYAVDPVVMIFVEIRMAVSIKGSAMKDKSFLIITRSTH